MTKKNFYRTFWPVPSTLTDFLSVFAITVLLAGLLGGCGAIGLGTDPTKTTTTTTTDPVTLTQTTTTTEEPAPMSAGGFFKSENLAEHYKFETSRLTNHESTADKKISAITTTINQIMALDGPTPTEKLLSGIIATQQISMIQTSPGPSGIAAPKTMVDVADKNIGNFTGLVFGVWDRVDDSRNDGGDSSVNIENTGDGMVFYQSDKNSAYLQSAKYTLGDSKGDLSFSAPSFTPTNTTTDRNDITNTSTRTDSSDSSTLW